MRFAVTLMSHYNWKSLKMISVELKRLTHLLNDMQDQNRHAPEIAIDFDVVLLICDLVTLVRYQIPKTISLEVDASQSYLVHLPEQTLRQAILNLLLNAAEAIDSSASGYICIKIYQSATGLTIQVVDNGAGFPENILDYGIPPLRTSRQRGTGLGLAMTQRLVNKMGGSIELSNQSPHGACVTMLLPDECIVETQ